VQLLVRGEVVALPLKGVIDLFGEKARLDKEIVKADADIKRVDAKLGNEKFVANAPRRSSKRKRKSARRRSSARRNCRKRWSGLKMAS
jgi:valyl-tRNA synthetase